MMTDRNDMDDVAMRGRRVILRDPIEPDLDDLRYWLGPDQLWQELDGPYYPKPAAAQIEAMIERLRESISNRAFPVLRRNLIISDSASDALLGRVSWYWESEETNWLSIGIVLYDPATWRCGYGHEALGLWCDYLFTAMPEIVRLDLRTWSGNRGMMALATKLGFQEEARFRRARIVRGEYFDGMGYGLLREEWQERYPHGFAASLASAIGDVTEIG